MDNISEAPDIACSERAVQRARKSMVAGQTRRKGRSRVDVESVGASCLAAGVPANTQRCQLLQLDILLLLLLRRCCIVIPPNVTCAQASPSHVISYYQSKVVLCCAVADTANNP